MHLDLVLSGIPRWKQVQSCSPLLTEVEGGNTGFTLYVCGQNRVYSVSLAILNGVFGKFFKFVSLTLSCFDLGSNMNQ